MTVTSIVERPEFHRAWLAKLERKGPSELLMVLDTHIA